MVNYANPDRFAAAADLAPVPRDSDQRSGNLRRPKRVRAHRGTTTSRNVPQD